MQPNIAFDMDGVIADFSSGFLPWVEEKYGIVCTPRDRFYWKIQPKESAIGIKRIIAEFIREHHHLITPLRDGSSLVYYVWEKTKKPITIITARDHSTIQASHDWFREWFPRVPHIIITVKSMMDKINYLDNFDTYVDDRRRTVVDLAIDGKTVIMPRRIYNMPVTDHKLLHPLNQRMIIVESLKLITNGSFDHLLFKT